MLIPLPTAAKCDLYYQRYHQKDVLKNTSFNWFSFIMAGRRSRQTKTSTSMLLSPNLLAPYMQLYG